jgi:hypothetical protein
MTAPFDPAKARRFDPLVRRSARHPFEHAAPADYAASIEGPREDRRPVAPVAPVRRASTLYKVLVALVAVPTLYLAGRLIIALIRAAS